VRTVFKAGVFRPQAELNSLGKLAVVATERETRMRDLNHLRARLVTKVRAKSLELSDHQIDTEVDGLLGKLAASPNETHFNAVNPCAISLMETAGKLLSPQMLMTTKTTLRWMGCSINAYHKAPVMIDRQIPQQSGIGPLRHERCAATCSIPRPSAARCLLGEQPLHEVLVLPLEASQCGFQVEAIWVEVASQFVPF
jgi:hypothetical protein